MWAIKRHTLKYLDIHASNAAKESSSTEFLVSPRMQAMVQSVGSFLSCGPATLPFSLRNCVAFYSTELKC